MSETRLMGWGGVLCLLLVMSAATPIWAGPFDSFVSGDQKIERRRDAPVESRASKYLSPPLGKLGRGFANVISSPLEIPATVSRTRRDAGWSSALVMGPIRGVGRMVVRLGSGVADLALFPFPPHRALWVDEAYVFGDATSRQAWVYDEAGVAQRELHETYEAHTEDRE